MDSPIPSERTSTFRCPSSLSRNENWSSGAPSTPSAATAEPSSGMRYTMDEAGRGPASTPQSLAHAYTAVDET